MSQVSSPVKFIAQPGETYLLEIGSETFVGGQVTVQIAFPGLICQSFDDMSALSQWWTVDPSDSVFSWFWDNSVPDHTTGFGG